MHFAVSNSACCPLWKLREKRGGRLHLRSEVFLAHTVGTFPNLYISGQVHLSKIRVLMPCFFEGLLIDEEGCPGCAIITSELF